MKNIKECWYCLEPIGKNHIRHQIIRNGKIRDTIAYCSVDCLMYEMAEMFETKKVNAISGEQFRRGVK